MFKKLKDKIEEEFKQAPLKFPVSVQQLAQVISPSPSVNSLSDNNASSSITYPTDISNVSTDFFSIGGDDDPQDGVTKMPLTLHNVDLTASSPSNMTHNMSRSRRSSLSSVTSEASSLFPIYEGGVNQNFFQSDMESEMEDGMSGQIEKISKEQLYQSFKKILNRYNKYKGRYTDLMKHYKELQHDNIKTKNVLQESQDKALRRMAELREQCQLEQKAKAHLEESLRNDVEERDHIIDTLKTKISLLSNGAEGGQLIDLESDQESNSQNNRSHAKELSYLKSQNEDLQKEVERLKKLKETACHLIHRCDTTINEATEDIKSDNLKQKMSELKLEIQKMKSENESLSHLLSKNIITDEDRKSQNSIEGSLIGDLSSLESSQGDQKMDEKDKKIEKLNNLLLKCKEKINGMTAEMKAKNVIIEENNKKLKELRDELDGMKAREEENALSVAENKKAIHEELDAKEEQIKALTKELKTKENEFIKEKEEVIKSYEEKIREMKTDFAKEMKTKTDQNQKLAEDLKAKEIVSGSLDKLKLMEDSFVNMLEFVRNESLAFEEMAKSKSVEIEKAQQKLEERVHAVGKNVAVLLENNKTAKSVENLETAAKQQKAFESQSGYKNPNADASESFHIVEKLKSDVINLSKKLEILETELEESRKVSKEEREEKDAWKEKCGVLEAEREKLKKDFEEKLNENAKLGKALTDKNEKIKKVESEKKLLQKATSEKVETESKLKEYVEKYTKVENENRSLQNDLIEKCGKLLKDLNESKEKIKSLENEEKVKGTELEQLRKEEKEKKEENEKLRIELETLKRESNESENRLKEELERVRKELEEIKTAEGERTAKELEAGEKKIKELETSLRDKEETIKQLEKEVETWKGKSEKMEKEVEEAKMEITREKGSIVRLQNELEAIRNNLKTELKEKEDKSILVDKLTQECNLLMAEIENLKKVHGVTERSLETELENVRKEMEERNAEIVKLRDDLEETRKGKEMLERESQSLREQCQSLTVELDSLKEKKNQEENLRLESASENEKIKMELTENEKTKKDLTDKITELTNEKNEVYGELQMKTSEVEALKKSLLSLREEFAEARREFEEEKSRLLSENENKLNVLKNEIKFIKTRHEEDLGNFEENLNSEVKEANEKMEIAEKTSAELVDKLERITNERDELKTANEEKNLKISELENCLTALKAELDEKFNEDAKDEEERRNKHSEEIKQIIIQYDREVAERDEEIEKLKSKLSELEDDEETNNRHREEVKQIIIRYDAEIGSRDEEIESLKAKLSGYDDALERLKKAKEELKTLKRELGERDSIIDTMVDEREEMKKDFENKILIETNENRAADELANILAMERLEREKREVVESLERAKKERDEEVERLRKEKQAAVEEEKKKWEGKMSELRAAHEVERRKWSSQKKSVNTDLSEVVDDNGTAEDVDLECTSKVAVAALETGSGSIDLLQKQLIQQAAEMKELKKQHKKEIIELKKMSASKKKSRRNSSENQDWLPRGGLENDTEHEYLRNILYEYMMGKEQLVLAKVLSAIVKFNEEQTHNVLEKEQQRQTLLGQLGLL